MIRIAPSDGPAANDAGVPREAQRLPSHISKTVLSTVKIGPPDGIRTTRGPTIKHLTTG